MRQSGTMTEGAWMQADATAEIQHSGQRVKVRRIEGDGSITYFYVYAKNQPLTPTFVHDIAVEGRENLLENDQRDFVVTGNVTMKDLDMISWGGYQWQVSTSSEMMTTGLNTTMHCLCVKQGAATF